MHAFLIAWLLIGCTAPEDEFQYPESRLISQPDDKLGQAQRGGQLYLGQDGKVRFNRLRWQQSAEDSAPPPAHHIVWKSWRASRRQLLWQQTISGPQPALSLPQMGISLDAEGAYRIEAQLRVEGKTVVRSSLPLALNPQQYWGGGWAGQIAGPHPATVVALQPTHGFGAIGTSTSDGSFYLKLPYRAAYTLLAFRSHKNQLHGAIAPPNPTSPPQLILEPLPEGQNWRLEGHQLHPFTGGSVLTLNLPPDLPPAPTILAVIGDGHVYLSHSNPSTVPVLRAPDKVFTHPQALLLAMLPGHRAHSQLLNPPTAPPPTAGEPRHIYLVPVADLTPVPTFKISTGPYLQRNTETGISGLVADNTVRGYQWLVDGRLVSKENSFTLLLKPTHPADHIKLAMQLQDIWGNTFRRHTTIPVTRGGVKWHSPQGEGPYWVAAGGHTPQQITFNATLQTTDQRIQPAKQRFHWFLWRESEDGSFTPLDARLQDSETSAAILSGLLDQALQLSFIRGGRYRLRVELASAYLLGLGDKESSYQRTFQVPPLPEDAYIEGPEQVASGQSIVLRAQLQNPQQYPGDTLSYHWRINNQKTLPKGFSAQNDELHYRSSLTAAQEQQWTIQLEVRTPFYPNGALAQHQLTEQPLALDLRINGPDPPLRVADSYTFTAQLNGVLPPPLMPTSLTYRWQLAAQAEEGSPATDPAPGTINGAFEAAGPSFDVHALQAGRYLLQLEASYHHQNRSRTLVAPPLALLFHTPPIRPRIEEKNTDQGDIEFSATVTNLEQLISEGNRLQYQWWEARGPSANALGDERKLDPLDLPAGYQCQQNRLTITPTAATLADAHRSLRVEVKDQIFPNPLSSPAHGTRMRIPARNLSLSLADQPVSQQEHAPTAISSHLPIRVRATIQDPDMLLSRLDGQATPPADLTITGSELSLPDERGQRQAFFTIEATSAKRFSFKVSSAPTRLGIEQLYYFNAQQAQPSHIVLQHLDDASTRPLSQDALQPTLLAAEQSHTLQLSFHDPGRQVGERWQLERIENGVASALSPNGDDMALVQENHSRVGEQQRATLRLILKAGIPANQPITLRLTLGSSGVSQHCYIQRQPIPAQSHTIHRRIGSRNYLLTLDQLQLPVGVSEQLLVTAYDPDRQLERIQLTVTGGVQAVPTTLDLGQPDADGKRTSPPFALHFQGQGTLTVNTSQSNSTLAFGVAPAPSGLALTTHQQKIVIQQQENQPPTLLPAGGPIRVDISITDPERTVYSYRFSSTTTQDFIFWPPEGCMVNAFSNALPLSRVDCTSSYTLRKDLPAGARRSFTVTALFHDKTPLLQTTFHLQVPPRSWAQHIPPEDPLLDHRRVNAVDGYENFVLMASDNGLIQAEFAQDARILALQPRQIYFLAHHVTALKVLPPFVIVAFHQDHHFRLALGKIDTTGQIDWSTRLTADSWNHFGTAADIGSIRIMEDINHSSGETLLALADDGRAQHSTSRNLLLALLKHGTLTIIQRQQFPQAHYLADLAAYRDQLFVAAEKHGVESWRISGANGRYTLQRSALYADKIRGLPIGDMPQHIAIVGDQLYLASWQGLFHGPLDPDTGQWNAIAQAPAFGQQVKRIFYDGQQLLVQNYRQPSQAYIGAQSVLHTADPTTLDIHQTTLENVFNVGGSLRLSMYHSQGRYLFTLHNVNSSAFSLATSRGETRPPRREDFRGLNLWWKHG